MTDHARPEANMKTVKVTVVLDRPLPLFGPNGVVQRVTGETDADNKDPTQMALDVEGKTVILYRPFIAAVIVESDRPAP